MTNTARFAASLHSQPPPSGFRTPCLIWPHGRELFTLDDGQQVTARTFALRERGVTLGKGQRVRILCKAPGCVAHVEPTPLP